MRREKLLQLTATALFAVGCASLTHKPVTDFAKPEGVPYYGGSHYLLIYSDGKGGLVWKLLYLADPNKMRVAVPSAIAANLDTKLTFTNGVLSESKATADSSAIPKAVIQTIEKALPLLAAANAPDGASHQLPAPTLYRVTWKGGQLHLVGGKAATSISLTLVKD